MRAYATKEDVRDAILDATDRLLAIFGYKKMTIDDLAREVAIGKGTVYLYFSSKEEIALSHIDRIIDRLKNQLQLISEQPISPNEKLRQMLIMRVMFRFDSVQHYSQSLNDLLAAIRPQLLARRSSYFDDEARIFAAVLAEGQRTAVFSIDDPTETAYTLLTATNSLLPYSLSTQELGGRDEIEKKTARLATLLLDGLRQNQHKEK